MESLCYSTEAGEEHCAGEEEGYLLGPACTIEGGVDVAGEESDGGGDGVTVYVCGRASGECTAEDGDCCCYNAVDAVDGKGVLEGDHGAAKGGG